MRLFRRALILLTTALLVAPASATKVTWQELLNTPLPSGGLLESPADFAAIVPPRAVPVEGLRFFTDVLRDVYDTFTPPPASHYFFCTVYYTPRETGFTADRGFDTKPTPMKGRRQPLFPADFTRAVMMEGFGRVAEPVDGQPYLAYTGRFHTRKLGSRGNTLIPRQTAAVNTRNPLVPFGRKLWILDREIYNQFGAALYEVGDTGGGLFRGQIDLYWGEDDPRGPGSDMFRAASCDVAVKWVVPVLLAD